MFLTPRIIFNFDHYILAGTFSNLQVQIAFSNFFEKNFFVFYTIFSNLLRNFSHDTNDCHLNPGVIVIGVMVKKKKKNLFKSLLSAADT